MRLFIDCDKTINCNFKYVSLPQWTLYSRLGIRGRVVRGKRRINQRHCEAHPALPVFDLIPLAAGSSCPTNKAQSECTLTQWHQSNGSLLLLLGWSFLDEFNYLAFICHLKQLTFNDIFCCFLQTLNWYIMYLQCLIVYFHESLGSLSFLKVWKTPWVLHSAHYKFTITV